MKPIEKKAEALRDLDEAFIYLAENGGLPLADRFLEAAEKSFSMLTEFPNIGSPIGVLLGHKLRKFPIKDFDEHLVFYITPEDMVVVVRVLNESQEWYKELGVKLNE